MGRRNGISMWIGTHKKSIFAALLSCLLTISACSAVLGLPQTAAATAAPGSQLYQAEKGSIVQFGGRSWILLDPAESKLLLKDPTAETYFWNYGYQFNYYQSYLNSSYRYLNHSTNRDGDPTFYSSLGSESEWIVPHAFDVTSDTGEVMADYGAPTIMEKVGLLSLAEYQTYSADPAINLSVSSHISWYLITPYRFDASEVGGHYVSYSGVARATSAELSSLYLNLRPVVHLKPELYITGGDGGSVNPYRLGTVTGEVTPNTPTAGPVTVSIAYPSGSTNAEYKIGSAGVYTAYSAPFALDRNSIIYVRYENPSLQEGSFMVTNLIVPAPDIIVSPVTWTPSATVEITYPEHAAVKEYRIDSGAWLPYTGGFAMTANGTVSARAQDEAGVYSEEASKTVANVDSSPPAAPVISVHTSLPAQTVTVSLTPAPDALTSEYRIGSGAYEPYSSPFVLSENATVYARSSDIAGNYSSESEYAISNIDTTPPIAPAITLGTDLPSQSVTVELTFTADSHVKMYKIDSGSYQLYTGPFQMTANGKVTAKAMDEAGNWSLETSKYVNNVDVNSPVISGVSNGAAYSAGVTPNSADTDIYSVQLLRNGSFVANYALGNVLAESGFYELTVTDVAGNYTRVSFSVGGPAAYSTSLASLRVGADSGMLYNLYENYRDNFKTTVSTSVYSVYIWPTAKEPGASLFINGQEVTSNGPTEVALASDITPLAIQVVSASSAARTYGLKISKSDVLQLEAAATDFAGESLTLTFNQPVQLPADLGAFQVSGNHAVVEAVNGSTASQIIVYLDTAVGFGESLRLSAAPGAVTGTAGIGSASAANFTVANLTLAADPQGETSVGELMNLMQQEQDINGDGLFDKNDVLILLSVIKSRFIVEIRD